MKLFQKATPLLVLLVGACSGSSQMAMGDVNSVIVAANDTLWPEVEDTVMTTLQPRIFAVRQEPTFQLTRTSPTGPHWSELRQFRQVLVLGVPDDPAIRATLSKAGTAVTPPAIVEANDVWARSQHVTALVLPPTGEAATVASNVDSLAALLDARYRSWAVERMYISGHDRALADTLARTAGFRVDIPDVYRWRQVGDSAYEFINDEPDASELVRSLLVTWRPEPAGEPSAGDALAWRDSAAKRFYDWGQVSEREPIRTSRLAVKGEPHGPTAVLQIRGIWSGTLEDFPQGGPFIARVVDCPSQHRRYLLDTWLYAPAKDKYQYIIQLETLLDSFRCAAAP